jgi:DNA segregation ATPase FtsK/SpoIIIE, S-DNA-T family
MADAQRDGQTDDGDAGNLPALRAGQDVEPDVLEGRIVSDDETTAPAVIRVVRVIVQQKHARFAWRNLAYIPIGLAVTVQRVWDTRTTARYERFIRAAEKAGDHEHALEWDDRMQEFRRDRHQRRVDMIEVPVRVLLVLPKIGLGLFMLLLAAGIALAVASKHVGEVAVPFDVAAQIVFWVTIAVSVSWGPFVLVLPWIALGALWWAGRAHANANLTGWLVAKKDGQDAGIVVTADTIVVALQNIDKIPALKRAFKDGWRPTFNTLPIRDGRGYFAVFGVPLGVTAAMIADSRPVFARNVHRAEVEVWPSDAEKAGVGPAGSVAVWIADPGVLSKAAPEYPLLNEGAADVFEGVPGGVVARGDGILVPLVGNNGVAGGMMGQGKSNACRVLMLGAALDPLAELDVYVFANNGDFDAFTPRLAHYRKGVEDDVIEAALARLYELYREVGRREQRLADLGAKKVTRSLAEAHDDLHPIVALFSECHELYSHPEYGEEAADVATKTVKRARKTAISLLFDTQSSRKEAIPPKLVELVSINICFYCKTWRSNDGFLGDGSFASGIRATELRPGRDRGTSLITGVSDAQFELLRWYFIEVDDDTGYDAATEVIARAMAQLAPSTRAAGSVPAAPPERHDLLADLAVVLGGEDDSVRLADLPALLRDHAPAWGPYRNLTGVQLRERLTKLGVRTTNAGNVPRLDPAELRRPPGDEELVRSRRSSLSTP